VSVMAAAENAENAENALDFIGLDKMPLLRHFGHMGDLLPVQATGPGPTPDNPVHLYINMHEGEYTLRENMPCALDPERLRQALTSLLYEEEVHLSVTERGEGEHVLRAALTCGYAEAAEKLAHFAPALSVSELVTLASCCGCPGLLRGALKRMRHMQDIASDNVFLNEDLVLDFNAECLRKVGLRQHNDREALVQCPCHATCLDLMRAAATEFPWRRELEFVDDEGGESNYTRHTGNARWVLAWALHVPKPGILSYDPSVTPLDAVHDICTDRSGFDAMFGEVLKVLAAAQLHGQAHYLTYDLKRYVDTDWFHGDHVPEKAAVAAFQGDAGADVSTYMELSGNALPGGTLILEQLLCFMSADDVAGAASALGLDELAHDSMWGEQWNEEHASFLHVAAVADNGSVLPWLMRLLCATHQPRALSTPMYFMVMSVQFAAALREALVLLESERDMTGGVPVSAERFLSHVVMHNSSTHVLGALFGVDVSVPPGTPEDAMGVVDLTVPFTQHTLRLFHRACGRTARQRAVLTKDAAKSTLPPSVAHRSDSVMPSLSHFCAVWGNQAADTRNLHVDQLQGWKNLYVNERDADAESVSLRWMLLLSTARPPVSMYLDDELGIVSSCIEMQQMLALRSPFLEKTRIETDPGEDAHWGPPMDLARYQARRDMDVPLAWYLRPEEDFLKLRIAAHEWAVAQMEGDMRRHHWADMPLELAPPVFQTAITMRHDIIAQLKGILRYNPRQAMVESRTLARAMRKAQQ